MTRIVIFGDLHANWASLLALQQAEPRPGAILCLGDIVGYGPDPKLCLDTVRASTAYVIGGRHDYSVAGVEAELQESGLMASTWPYARSVLSGADLDYLTTLPKAQTVVVAGIRFHLARLAPDDADTETRLLITLPQARLREMFGHIEADFILLGGPHVPALRQFDSKLVICPGSLGQPRYGVPDPTFAAWEDGRVQIHHLHYHPDDTIHKLSLLPLDPEYRLQLQAILQTGGLE